MSVRYGKLSLPAMSRRGAQMAAAPRGASPQWVARRPQAAVCSTQPPLITRSPVVVTLCSASPKSAHVLLGKLDSQRPGHMDVHPRRHGRGQGGLSRTSRKVRSTASCLAEVLSRGQAGRPCWSGAVSRALGVVPGPAGPLLEAPAALAGAGVKVRAELDRVAAVGPCGPAPGEFDNVEDGGGLAEKLFVLALVRSPRGEGPVGSVLRQC